MKAFILLISAMLFIRYETNGEELMGQSPRQDPPFQCPVNCTSSASYKPICSRGKSYANLCTLQHQICDGNAAAEIYNDVEDCPKYEEDEDKKGASVEAIDKNGVIFRNFMEPANKTEKKIVGDRPGLSTVDKEENSTRFKGLIVEQSNGQ